MNFKQLTSIVRSGTLMKKKIEVPETTIHCLNCGTEYEDSYCPHCGQYWKVRRITLSNIIETVSSNIFGFQSNLPRTMLSLLYRPGYLINDYLRGKRREYTNPFSLIIILAAITLFISKHFAPEDFHQLAKEFSEGHFQVDSAENDFTSLTEQVMQFVNDNLGMFSIALLPILVIPLWLTYRRQGIYKEQPMNYWESIVMMAYFTCIGMVYSIFLSIFSHCFFTPTPEYFLITNILFMMLMIWQMFQMKPLNYLRRLGILVLHSIWFFFLLTFITIVIFIVTLILRYKDWDPSVISR